MRTSTGLISVFSKLHPALFSPEKTPDSVTARVSDQIRESVFALNRHMWLPGPLPQPLFPED
jgi:hypothetical protein